MAKLKAHGAEIGTLYTMTGQRRYMSDGQILTNHGHGWKLHGKIKDGVTPQQAFERAQERQKEFIAANPMTAAYKSALHDTAPACKRWKLHLAISMMPDDPDGAWSDACDGYGDNIHADLDDVVRLCDLYKLALTERKALQTTKDA
jgi:hypothetical protein